MTNNRNQAYRVVLLASLLASSIHFCNALAAENQATPPPGTAPASASSASASSASAMGRSTPTIHTVGSPRGVDRYREIWGIDDLKLIPTGSGRLIRFSYRVLDPQKAQVLNDKKKEPYLLLDGSGKKIGIETGERVGQLRQTADQVAGREYWMMFGNANHSVNPGDRVDVVIGPFHAYGLYVEAPPVAIARKQ